MPLEEAFKLAGVISDRAVQSAIGAGSARAAAAEYPDLADLIRREQDTLKQIDVMQASLANQIAAPFNQQLPAIINNLKNEIENLRKAQTILINEIEKVFLNTPILQTLNYNHYLRLKSIYIQERL